MQTATGTLIAAIQSREQQPVVQVRADWRGDGTFSFDPGVFSDTFSDTFPGLADLGDLSPFVESWSVNRSLSTDLPDAVKLAEGFPAAEATVTLAGNAAGIDLCALFAPYDNPISPFSARIGAPLTIDAGYRSTAGAEVLRQFTGKVRSVSVDPEAGTVSLSCLDSREQVRTPVTLPVLAADDNGTVRPGLWGQFLMDWVARANGYYASPPVRSQCFLSAPLHGSAWPEVGTLTTAGVASGSAPRGQAAFVPLGSGAMGIGAIGGLTSNARWTVATGLNTNSGSNLFIEAAVRISGAGGRVALVRSVAGVWTAAVDCVAGAVQVTVQRNGATSGAVSIALAGLTVGADHYVGVHIAFTGTGFNANARVDGASGSATGVVGSSTGSPDLSLVDVGVTATVIVAALQVTNEAFSAGMFNNTFSPSAVFEQSLNNLTATPVVDTSDPWDLLQQLAKAEQGTIGFDENGALRFNNRSHMTGGAAVATVTTDPAVGFANLMARASSEAIDSVRNYVTVPAQPYTLDPAGTGIWSSTETLEVIAGATLTVPVEFDGTVYTLASVAYLATQNADGTGGAVSNLTVAANRVTATTYTITVRNPNAFSVFLVADGSGGSTAGDPALNVYGRLLRAGDTYNSIREDPTSQARYGRQSLDIGGSPFMQSMAAAQNMSDALVTALGVPHSTLESVDVVADPRLQIGDRTRVVDADGLALDHDFWAVGIQSQGSASGYTQTLALRQAD